MSGCDCLTKWRPLSYRSQAHRGSRAVGACPAQTKEDKGPMAGTLTAPIEALLHEQVAKGHVPSMDRVLEVAVKTVYGRRASHALESLLNEALSHPGERVPISQLRGTTA